MLMDEAGAENAYDCYTQINRVKARNAICHAQNVCRHYNITTVRFVRHAMLARVKRAINRHKKEKKKHNHICLTSYYSNFLAKNKSSKQNAFKKEKTTYYYK